MDNLLPDIDPKTYTGTAVAAGYVLAELLNTNEKIAFANWLELIADILETNAAYEVQLQVQEEIIKAAQEDNKDDLTSKVEGEVEGEISFNEIHQSLLKMQEDIALIRDRI